MRGNTTRFVAAFAVSTLAFGLTNPARAEMPDPTDAVTAVVREACALAWIDGLCEPFAYPDPGYQVDADPSPGEPFALRIGSVHEHTGYSDGHPGTRPADVFAAGRTGQNFHADNGENTGVIVDYMLSSDHSDNEKLPITTAEVCLEPGAPASALGILGALSVSSSLGLDQLLFSIPPLLCSRITEADHYRKWEETLAQAVEATDYDPVAESYNGFTAIRGFEWTNDRHNHLGVYFGRNITNAKIDLSYWNMESFWNWLRRPADRGGGSDALVVFNHPTAYSWEGLKYVPDVDDRVAGMEVYDAEGLTSYIKALTNGWHIGPLGAEDEHGRAWSSSESPKTLMLTRGRSPGDYYFALANHRTVSLSASIVGGDPGTPARHPTVHYWAGGDDIQDSDATVLGGVVNGDTQLHVSLDGVPVGQRVVMVSNTSETPIRLGQAGADGTFDASLPVSAPGSGEDWYAVVSCTSVTTECGVTGNFDIVTAPVWVTP